MFNIVLNFKKILEKDDHIDLTSEFVCIIKNVYLIKNTDITYNFGTVFRKYPAITHSILELKHLEISCFPC